MSPRAAAYQRQITGRTGQAYIVNGVKFDGFENGTLIEAKGPGYAGFKEHGEFKWFFTGKNDMIEQAKNQIIAARGEPITWHIAEAVAADTIRKLFHDNGIEGISVVQTPAEP